jgi:D-lactate dehydrogenase (cytochrome)
MSGVEEKIRSVDEKFQDYLTDESRLQGRAEGIFFPESEADIREFAAWAHRNGAAATIQGGRTGLAGGAVPAGGCLLNLSKMCRVGKFFRDVGAYFLEVEPGLSLRQLRQEIKQLKSEAELFWPPDPTETSASVGGIVSCSARGLCAPRYGSTNRHVAGARIVLAGGGIMELRRGERFVSLGGAKMDLLDLFIGGEGIFGVLSRVTLQLQPRPPHSWGFIFFLEQKETLYAFVEKLKGSRHRLMELGLAAAEYMDHTTLQLMAQYGGAANSLKAAPPPEPGVLAAIYLEAHCREEEAGLEIADKLLEMAAEANCDPDKAWAASGEGGVEQMREFRHAAAAAVNFRLARARLSEPRLTGLDLYLAADDEDFAGLLEKYVAGAAGAGLNVAIYGHLLGNRLRVNLLPESYAQYEEGRRLLAQWALELAGRRAQADRQHGIGKLKRELFLQTAPRQYIEDLKKFKDYYDPAGMWNRGTLLPPAQSG